MCLCVIDDSADDFLADARKIQQEYINRSSPSLELPEPTLTAAVITIPASRRSSEPHSPAAVASRTGGPVVVKIPPSTNAVPTTVKIPPPSAGRSGPSKDPVVPVIAPPSPFANDSSSAEVSPVSSTLRSVITRPQSTSVVFRASPRAARDSTQTGTVPARTSAGLSNTSKLYTARRTDQ